MPPLSEGIPTRSRSTRKATLSPLVRDADFRSRGAVLPACNLQGRCIYWVLAATWKAWLRGKTQGLFLALPMAGATSARQISSLGFTTSRSSGSTALNASARAAN